MCLLEMKAGEIASIDALNVRINKDRELSNKDDEYYKPIFEILKVRKNSIIKVRILRDHQ
ncbi:MAG: hypothetical protein P8Y35_08655 [Sulfurovaceae bacterium]